MLIRREGADDIAAIRAVHAAQARPLTGYDPTLRGRFAYARPFTELPSSGS